MAPTHIAVDAQPVSESVLPNLDLAHRAAALLVRVEPRRDAELVVLELLENLKSERIEREARGLNHWEEHAPRFLSTLVRQARRERRRRFQEAETFFRARHKEVVDFARSILGDREAAESVASDTYLELLDGRATIPGFFAALVCNARNYMEGESYRRSRNDFLEEAFSPYFPNSEGANDDEPCSSFAPASGHREDKDPLDILIAREDERERQELVAKAMKDPRWRYIKRRDWAAALVGDVRN